jgi:spore photoproduct lyase
MNIGMGCPYECSYCFLQGYQNIGGIVLPYNIDDYLREDKISLLGNDGGFFNYKRIGSGEFTDSLVFDHISNFSPKIVEFFRAKKEIYFEFKTKSINISNLLSVGGAENVVVAWSLNSFKMKKENEFKTPSILERLNAAKAVAEAGFSVAFHFDPLIFYPDWRAGYKETVDALFDIVPNGAIKWISLGALRMAAELKKVIENRFPRNKIMDAELLLDSDYKLKYSADTRIEMFDFMLKLLGQKTQKTQIYLCMENKLIHKSVKK